MIEILTGDAYREACTALGEAIVRERFLSRHVAQLEAALDALRPVQPADGERLDGQDDAPA